MGTQKIDASEWDCIGHFYEPIAFYSGRVLKYQGRANARNREWMMAKPGMIMVESYKGDRITADTHALFTLQG